MSEISGDTGDVKRSVIEYMESFLETAPNPGSYIPEEILGMMTSVTSELSREVAVCLNRRNRVVKISLGDSRSVSLPDSGGRKNDSRLSGVRLLHTHPNGSVMPSEVDINSLKSMRYDSMVVIGINTEKRTVTGISATVLERGSDGSLFGGQTYGPYLPSQAGELDKLFAISEELDRNAKKLSSKTDDGAERAILVGVAIGRDSSTDAAENELRELSELAKTAGAIPVAFHVQHRPAPDPKLYIGKGLASDLSLERQALDASLIIFDDELSPSQAKNLEDATGAKVIDRTALILDIFAARANSMEGALQVELAQQKYRLSRLSGTGTSLSRLGGGIGTRGPGETKLQTDRRHILRRIRYLETELCEVARRRENARKDRSRKNMPVIALVGYTNAGKSTIMNALCGSDVFAKDMLFATLDPSVRGMTDSAGKKYLLIDTVGFIRKLPHTLIEAFKSTLEEAAKADLLIHVAESDSNELEEKLVTVDTILSEIGAGGKPRILVLNKTDKPGALKEYPKGDNLTVICTDAVTGTGLDELKDAVSAFFSRSEQELCLMIPYSDGRTLSYIRKHGSVLSEDYTENGTFVRCLMPEEYVKKVSEYEVFDQGEYGS